MLVLNLNGDQRLIQGFEEAKRRIGSAKPVLDDIGKVLKAEFRDNFAEEGRRLNEPWKQLKANTLKQKIRMGYGGAPILVRTGHMRDSFRKEVSRSRVRVYNPTPYFKYHQRGDKPQPRRRMILFPDRLKQEVVRQFTKYIHEGLKGR